MTWSIVALLAALAAAFLTVSLLARLVQAPSLRWLVAAVIWCAAIAGFVVVDVNVPLSESHFYPSGAPAPLWFALAACFARFAAFASLALARQSSEQPVAECQAAASRSAEQHTR